MRNYEFFIIKEYLGLTASLGVNAFEKFISLRLIGQREEDRCFTCSRVIVVSLCTKIAVEKVLE